MQRERWKLPVQVPSRVGDGDERVGQKGRPDFRRVPARLPHGRLVLQHSDWRTVRQVAQAQFQQALQQQQGTPRPPLPRLVAQEQEGVQGGVDQVHRGDAGQERRVLRHHGPGEHVAWLHVVVSIIP